jgi:hypothetical protein
MLAAFFMLLAICVMPAQIRILPPGHLRAAVML